MYTPILKVKQAEMDALRKIPPSLSEAIYPLFEFILPKGEEDSESPLLDQCKSLKDSLPHGRDVMVDLYNYLPGTVIRDGIHPLAFIFRIVSQHFNIVPVIGPEMEDGYSAVVERLLQRSRDQRLALRVLLSSEDTNKIIQQALKRFNVTPEQVDLIIDAKSIAPIANRFLRLGVTDFLDNLAYIEQWRSIVLCGTSIPSSFNSDEYPQNAITPIARREWHLWQHARTLLPNIRFGDYAAANNELPPTGKHINPVAKIVYTTDDDIILVRGISRRDGPPDQYRTLASKLIQQDYYCGADYSWGDQYISNCATVTNVGPGNLPKWRSVAVSHHLTFVVDQLAN